MYKLVAFDLDNTLLNNEKTIDEKNIKAIRSLIDSGIKVVIATGRAYSSAKKLTSSIKRDLVYASNNGTVIREGKNDRLLYENILEKSYAKDIIEHGEKIGISPLVHVNRLEEGIDVVYKKGNPVFKDNKSERLSIKEVEEFTDSDLEKILALAFFGPVEKVKKLYKEKALGNEDKYNSHIMESISVSDSLVEFMEKDGNKWNGLMHYANIIKLNPEEIVVFGDDNNDVEMIENAGLGIAMKNGTKNVKKAADRISKYDNNNLGIYYELKEIFDIKD